MTTNAAETNQQSPTTRPRPGVGARRFGYVISILVNGAFLYLLNVWPTWHAVPFLTPETAQVLPWINASAIAAIVANLVYLFADPVWLRALGDVVTTAFGLVALVQIWTVFPFEYGAATIPWSLLTQILIVIAIVGSAIAIVVQLVNFARGLVRSP